MNPDMERNLKLYLIVDEIIGEEGDQFDYDGVMFDSESVMTEEAVKFIAEVLKEGYPGMLSRNQWHPVRFYAGGRSNASLRALVDDIIDSGNLVIQARHYVYSESDRREIVQKCAATIQKRVSKYAGSHRVVYKVFDNGEVGFRYE